jgi:hypothetical protein
VTVCPVNGSRRAGQSSKAEVAAPCPAAQAAKAIARPGACLRCCAGAYCRSGQSDLADAEERMARDRARVRRSHLSVHQLRRNSGRDPGCGMRLRRNVDYRKKLTVGDSAFAVAPARRSGPRQTEARARNRRGRVLNLAGRLARPACGRVGGNVRGLSWFPDCGWMQYLGAVQ